MDKPLFIMESKRIGGFHYYSLALSLSLAVFLRITPDAGIFLFFTLVLIPVMVKHRTILVFDNSLTEKDSEGRFIKEINAQQIGSFQRTCLGKLSLVDRNQLQLLSIKSNMTNRDRFEQWLAAHNIESK